MHREAPGQSTFAGMFYSPHRLPVIAPNEDSLTHKHSFHLPLAITRLQGNCKGNLHEHGIQGAILSFRGRDDCVLGSSNSPTSISMRSSCLQIFRAESRGQRSTSKYHNVSSSIITLSTSCMTRKKIKSQGGQVITRLVHAISIFQQLLQARLAD